MICAGSASALADPPAGQPAPLPPLTVQAPNSQAKNPQASPQAKAAVQKPPRPKTSRGLPAVATVAPSPVDTSLIPPRGRVYLFRGALGLIFSRGMDRLTEKLQRAGLTADVYEFTICSLITNNAVDTYKRDPAPIILIGHSMGGRCALQFAETLQAQNIPVSLIVTIDPAHLSPDVPTNVERYINIFLSKDVLGGGNIKAVQGFPGHFASYDLDQHGEVSHISIDKMDAIHQQIVAKVREIAVTPARTEGETVPLHYVVPPDEPTELWDSGVAVSARAGDTLQSLAPEFHVPLWALTQINSMSDSAPLTDGQRVVVPRHLTPAPPPVTAVAQPAPPPSQAVSSRH
jgi:LysM repeat protein